MRKKDGESGKGGDKGKGTKKGQGNDYDLYDRCNDFLNADDYYKCRHNFCDDLFIDTPYFWDCFHNYHHHHGCTGVAQCLGTKYHG